MINDDFFPECYLDIDLVKGIYKFNGIIASSRLKNLLTKTAYSCYLLESTHKEKNIFK